MARMPTVERAVEAARAAVQRRVRNVQSCPDRTMVWRDMSLYILSRSNVLMVHT